MAVYVVTGKLGGGKTLVCVGKIKEALLQQRRVATNLDLELHNLLGPFYRDVDCIRIPDKPRISDLEVIGNGNPTYDESRNGLLVLDECGTWFNSRNWNDKDRKPVNDWFLHARKLGWDVLLIIQDVTMLDSQARESIAEHTVFCKRLDRFAIPVIGTLIKAITGSQPRLPRVHLGRVTYGITIRDPFVDRWVYRGNELFNAYDTKQAFSDNYQHTAHCVLPPWTTHGRYMVPRDKEFYMRMTKIYWKRLKTPAAFALGGLTSLVFSIVGAFAIASTIETHEPETTNDLPPAEVLQVEPDYWQTLFAESKIVDHWTFRPEIIHYKFQRGTAAEGEDPDTYTSDELEEGGFIVSSINECRAVITDHQNRDHVVYCF